MADMNRHIAFECVHVKVVVENRRKFIPDFTSEVVYVIMSMPVKSESWTKNG